MARTCNSGIDSLGPIPWGSHFCNFYQQSTDLAACLVPFFRQGLVDNAMCIWITSDPLNAREARRLLGEIQADLAGREATGQMLIADFADWYLNEKGSITVQALRSCIDQLAAAQQRGFAGVRLSGNSFWLERKYWSLFTEYEKQLQATLHNSRIVVLCSYSMERCSAKDVLNVVNHHDFALARDEKGWQRIESSTLG
jgi:hypothetical protein